VTFSLTILTYCSQNYKLTSLNSDFLRTRFARFVTITFFLLSGVNKLP